jgi:PAS domain S-box-containing protein
LRRADGVYRWILDRGVPHHDDAGALVGYVASCVDVTEQRLDRNALHEIQERLTFALEAGQMGEWSFSADRGDIHWSPAMERLCGLEVGSFDGTLEAALAVVHPEDVAVVQQRIEDALTDPETPMSLVYRVVTPSGEVRWLDTRAQPVDAERREWIGVAIDVTRRYRAEAGLRETVSGLDTLLGHAPAGFAFFDREFRFVHVNEPMARIGGLPQEAHIGRTISELLPELWVQVEPILQRVSETGKPAIDIDVIAQTPGVPGVDRHFLTSYYPVHVDGVAVGYGALLVDITEHRRSEIAAQLLAEAGDLLSEEPRVEDVIERAVRIPIPELADACTLYLRPTEISGALTAVAHVDPALEERMREAFRRHDHEDPDEPAADILRHGTSMRVELVTSEMRGNPAVRPEDRALIDAIGVHSWMATPIGHGTKILGSLAFLSTVSNRRFQESDVEIAEHLAERIGLAVDNARLAAIAAVAQTRLQLLARAGEISTQELDSTKRLQFLTHLLVPDLADLAAVHIARHDGHLELLDVASRSGVVRDERESWPPMPVDDNPAPVAVAFRTGEPVVLPEIPDELMEQIRGASVAGAPHRLGVTSALALPLRTGDITLGTFTICFTDSGRRYSTDDVPLVEELARRVAVAVQHARRYEAEQETASLLQLSLLPERLPQVAGVELVARYLPGSAGVAVGGDWYDVVPLEDGGIVLAIGDVVGHGIAAAASMGRVRSALQLCAVDGDSPTRILERLNGYLVHVGAGDMATVLIAHLSLRPLGLTLASAGHPPAALIPPAGASSYVDITPGPPLGAAPGASYPESSVELELGTSLVLYTDGLVERRGEQLDVGLDRLRKTLDREAQPLERLADALLQDLEAMDRDDDVALLAARLLPAGDELDIQITADARELATTRQAIGTWLSSRGVADDETAEIVVAVNEAVSNAVAHAYRLNPGTIHVEARDEDQSVVFVIRDHGRWSHRATEREGRGLQMMRVLMDDVEIESGSEGTAVFLRRRLRRVRG